MLSSFKEKCCLLSQLELTNFQVMLKSTRMSIWAEFLMCFFKGHNSTLLYPWCFQEPYKTQLSQVFTPGGLHRNKYPQRDWSSYCSCHCNAAAAGGIHKCPSWWELLLQMNIIQTGLPSVPYLTHILVVYITITLQTERRGQCLSHKTMRGWILLSDIVPWGDLNTQSLLLWEHSRSFLNWET